MQSNISFSASVNFSQKAEDLIKKNLNKGVVSQNNVDKFKKRFPLSTRGITGTYKINIHPESEDTLILTNPENKNISTFTLEKLSKPINLILELASEIRLSKCEDFLGKPFYEACEKAISAVVKVTNKL